VDHAGIKKNALRQRRLARVDVRGDADVPRRFERETCDRAKFGFFVVTGFSRVAVAIENPYQRK